MTSTHSNKMQHCAYIVSTCRFVAFEDMASVAAAGIQIRGLFDLVKNFFTGAKVVPAVQCMCKTCAQHSTPLAIAKETT